MFRREVVWGKTNHTVSFKEARTHMMQYVWCFLPLDIRTHFF